MKTKLIILRGLPKSGKSTYAKFLLKDNNRLVRISNKDICNMAEFNEVGKASTRKMNKLIKEFSRDFMMNLLVRNYSVVIDDNNLNNRILSYFIEPVILHNKENEELQIDIEIYEFFDTPLHVCIKRDSYEKEKSLGSCAITKLSEHKEPIKDAYMQYLKEK